MDIHLILFALAELSLFPCKKVEKGNGVNARVYRRIIGLINQLATVSFQLQEVISIGRQPWLKVSYSVDIYRYIGNSIT